MKLKLHFFFLFSTFFLLMFSAVQNFLSAQARLVLGNTSAAYMVLNGGTAGTPIYIVVGNASAAAASNTITRNSVAGIISEGEFNYVKWYIGNGTGTGYLLPWRDNTAPATAGTAGGFFLASTYDGTWDNDTYKPAPVTNMTNSSGGNNSAYVLDRFWSLIDETSYATHPVLNNLVFTYPDNNEFTAGSNTITESDLQAQRWNSSSANPNKWDGWILGTDVPAANTVSVTAVAAADMWRWWTLVSKLSPLPVEWLGVSAECNRGTMTIKWSTASEQNSSYFTVERSLDGTNFTAIATKEAAHTSSTIKNYFVVDTDPYSGTSFYRINETDFNGSSSYSSIVSVGGCSDDDITVYGSGGDVAININAVKDGQYAIELYDVLGQKIMDEIKNVTAGSNYMKLTPGNIAGAIYVVKVYNSSNAVTKKIFIR